MSQKLNEPAPFVQLSWNSTKIRRKWEPIRDEIYKAAHFAEYEGIKRGHRHCDVYHVDSMEFDWQLQKIFDDGLFWQPVVRSRNYDGPGRVHYVADKLGEGTFVYGVVADTLENAQKFREAGIGEIDHVETGLLLGYGQSCIDWFLDVWLKKHIPDPMYELAENSENHEINEDGSITVSGDPRINRLIRHFRFSALPQELIPCSIDCPEAIEFADWFYGIMYEQAPDACDSLLEALNMPMTWSLVNAIIYVQHPLFRGAVNGYWFPKKRVVHWRGE